VTTLVYLHGFASGPGGRKGLHCRAWAERHRVPFRAPDLNLPDFEHLTISAQVEAVEALLAGLDGPAVVVGSSMGGLVGAAVAHRGAAMAQLILLAPAFGFARRRLAGRRWAGYRKRGTMPTFHHATGKWTTLGPELLPDLPLWADDDRWQIPVPVTVLHGRHDAAVPLAESEAFAGRHGQAKLVVVEDDHGLLGAEALRELDRMLAEAFGRA
jgi:hypothetical protein